MSLLEKIIAYQPVNEQEEHDKEVMIQYIKEHEDYLDRSNLVGHFSASVWAVNKEHTKVLMVYHNIYDSWSWAGGHADGIDDLSEVALRELKEETGVSNAHLVSDDIFSLEILTVDGHIKKGIYVPSHLHLNITYLAEADEEQELTIKQDENQGVRWCTLEETVTLPTESWMIENIYKKLIQKVRRIHFPVEEK